MTLPTNVDWNQGFTLNYGFDDGGPGMGVPALSVKYNFGGEGAWSNQDLLDLAQAVFDAFDAKTRHDFDGYTGGLQAPEIVLDAKLRYSVPTSTNP